jgi:SAM-dependent methyltransferase
MGCGMEFLKWLDGQGAFPRSARILDIGESYLLAATEQDIREFLSRHKKRWFFRNVDRIARHFAFRSHVVCNPQIQTLFLSELIELTDLDYVAFDVVNARKARLFDLNNHRLAQAKRETFDVVLNFGTTEHVLNQFNAFRVMHDAVKPGGLMFHQVPTTGYVNHGYYLYHVPLFEELADANAYDIVDLWFYGPQGCGNLCPNMSNQAGLVARDKPGTNVLALSRTPVPNALINVLFRKKRAGEFRAAA